MDIQEYVYSKPAEGIMNYRCRFCHEVIKTVDIYRVISLNRLEEDSVNHLMGCQKFFEVRKTEIEDSLC